MPNAAGQVDIFDQLLTSPNPYANSAALQALFRNYLGQARLQFFINQTDLLAPTVQDLVAPFNGTVTDLVTTVETAITTGGTIGVDINGSAVTNCSNTIANSATKGTRARATANSPTPFAPGSDSTNVCSKGDRITIVPASFATAGAVNGFVEITPR